MSRRRRRLGQHFLRDPDVAEYMASQVPQGATVLEVGAGDGVLTMRLAQRASRVYAIEVDRALAQRLAARAPPNVQVVVGDALELPWPPADFFASNVPYSITSPLMLKLCRHRLPAVVTVQREVAERLAARPGTEQYGRLTVAVQCHYAVEILRVVPPHAFSPPPRVYSAVVRLSPRGPCVDDFEAFERFTARLFSARRKTLRRLGLADSARRVYQLSLEELVELFSRVGGRPWGGA